MILFYSCMTVIFLIARPEGGRTRCGVEEPTAFRNKRRKVRVSTLSYNDELRRELEAHNCIEVGGIGRIKAILEVNALSTWSPYRVYSPGLALQRDYLQAVHNSPLLWLWTFSVSRTCECDIPLIDYSVRLHERLNCSFTVLPASTVEAIYRRIGAEQVVEESHCRQSLCR